tara:strand:- start:78 stop:692 length:615 start_codon:yes stop_codon:yes gene_type:complete
MKLESMSKAQLEAHGRTVGIELDRRLVKSELISQLKDYISAQQIAEEMELEAEDNDLDFMAQVLEDADSCDCEDCECNPCECKDPVVTEAELAAEMLAAMALQSATAATHEANVAQADVDYSRAVQSAKDARGMADRAVETQRQIEAQVVRTRQMVIEAQNASDEATRNSVAQAQLTASAVQASKDAMEHEAMMLTAKTALANM